MTVKCKADAKIEIRWENVPGESDFHYSEHIICCKWYNKPVLFLETNVGMSGVSNKSLTKGSANKTPVSCPNITKLYNNGMSVADIMNQKTAAYRLTCKSKYCFYLRMFSDLIDVSHVNSHIVDMKVGGCHIITVFQNCCGNFIYSNCKISVGQADENLMNHLSPEKSQPPCLSSRRSK